MAGEQTYSRSMAGQDVQAIVEARVRAAIDEGAKRPRLQIAEPQGWWNIWAMGPVQAPAAGGPLLPHKVIKENETFQVATVVWFSPVIPPGALQSPCNLITNLGCQVLLEYCTNDMCRLARAPQFMPTTQPIKINLIPNQCWYVDVQTFTAPVGSASCIYEMNICARCTGCQPGAAPQLAGFATEVYDFDADTFYPAPPGAPAFPPAIPPAPAPPPGGPPPGGAAPFGTGPVWRSNMPIRFQVYP